VRDTGGGRQRQPGRACHAPRLVGAGSLNDAGQVVGLSNGGGIGEPPSGAAAQSSTWGLLGSTVSAALGINDAGQAVGSNDRYAAEWSGGGSVTELEVPFSTISQANGINDAGQVVGMSILAVPESSTWAMMLAGFAGLAFAGCRRAKAGHTTSRALALAGYRRTKAGSATLAR
jgi:uncharacterized membrane protein